MTGSIINEISKEGLQNIVGESNSLREVLRFFGLGGGAHLTLKKRLEKDNIDYSHFNKIGKHHKKFSNEEVFTENSSYGRGHIKKRIIEQNLIPYKCSICGQEHSWNEKELVLILDHKNGINNDHRLENLRFLCPNCNSQQDTFAGKNSKNIKKHYFCIECGKEISKGYSLCKKCSNIKRNKSKKSEGSCIECGKKIRKQSIRCSACENKRKKDNYKGNRPPKKQLLQDILEMPLLQVGKKYGVSDNAIRKWCKHYELPTKLNDIKKLR